tara:strand:+ start:165 stop:482 length:318 start_codon:yes stop_codon:yes gene_type:complete
MTDENISYDNDMIFKIVNQYKRKRDMEKKRYDTVLKIDPEYKKKCCERSRLHYQKNKEKRRDKYLQDKEFNNAKQLLSYYTKNNNLETFKDKHPDKLELVKHLIN